MPQLVLRLCGSYASRIGRCPQSGRTVVERRRAVVGRRQLLTNEERQLLLGVPRDPDILARHYTFTRSDQELITSRRGAANQLGFAVQLALLRHPGRAMAQVDEPIDVLVSWLAAHLEVPVAAFAEYARRPQTMTDHARLLAATLGLRPAGRAAGSVHHCLVPYHCQGRGGSRIQE